MKKPEMLALLCICASVSIADAQTATPTAIVPRARRPASDISLSHAHG
jgi:hypothetical protein